MRFDDRDEPLCPGDTARAAGLGAEVVAAEKEYRSRHAAEQKAQRERPLTIFSPTAAEWHKARLAELDAKGRAKLAKAGLPVTSA